MVDREYRKAEYDAFGPWILEITEKHPLPPLFIPYFADVDGAGDGSLMRVKIPRDVERRNVNPDMDLYDCVIALYEDRAYVLERAENRVRETTIPYGDIEGLENFVDHLSARLTVYAGDRTLAIPYNAVSEPIVNDLMRVIRDRYAGKRYSKLRSPYADPESVIQEVIFANLLGKSRANAEGFAIAAIQPSVKLRNGTKTIGKRILQALTGKRLLGSVYLASERETLILSRGKPFKTNIEVVYSRSYFYVPMDKLRSAALERDGRYDNLMALSMKTRNHGYTFYVDGANAEAGDYCATLDAMVKS
jgi:hypothetical protein